MSYSRSVAGEKSGYDVCNDDVCAGCDFRVSWLIGVLLSAHMTGCGYCSRVPLTPETSDEPHTDQVISVE